MTLKEYMREIEREVWKYQTAVTCGEDPTLYIDELVNIIHELKVVHWRDFVGVGGHEVIEFQEWKERMRKRASHALFVAIELLNIEVETI